MNIRINTICGAIFNHLSDLGLALHKEGLIAERDSVTEMAMRIRRVGLGQPMEPESPPDPRPTDMAELARLVAKELRKRGIWADAIDGVVTARRHEYADSKLFGLYGVYESDFDKLTPSECADVIQAEEARKAQEWAGDA